MLLLLLLLLGFVAAVATEAAKEGASVHAGVRADTGGDTKAGVARGVTEEGRGCGVRVTTTTHADIVNSSSNGNAGPPLLQHRHARRSTCLGSGCLPCHRKGTLTAALTARGGVMTVTVGVAAGAGAGSGVMAVAVAVTVVVAVAATASLWPPLRAGPGLATPRDRFSANTKGDRGGAGAGGGG